jgi:hypothetical protein
MRVAAAGELRQRLIDRDAHWTNSRLMESEGARRRIAGLVSETVPLACFTRNTTAGRPFAADACGASLSAQRPWLEMNAAAGEERRQSCAPRTSPESAGAGDIMGAHGSSK